MKIVEMNWRDNPWFPEVLNDERLRDLQARPDDYDHIWEGGFKVNQQGAYYAANLNQAREEGRIGKVPVDPALPVRTYWDLGLDDATAVWFAQEIGKEVRLIEYQEWSQAPLTQVASEVMGKRYVYADHVLPHDVRVRELTTGRSREEILRSLLGKLTVAPMLSVEDGINAGRVLFSRLWFDEKGCEKGIEALRNYAKRWDDKRKTFEDRPYHNWASHGADAFRMLAVSYKDKIDRGQSDRYGKRKPVKRSAWAA
jgi:phage terminase large subunit